MAQHDTPEGRADDAGEPPSQDPWRAFSYVLTGVAFYGLVGWGLDQWWGTTYLVGIGIVVGAVLGLYLTWRVFATPGSPGDQDTK
ncbi:AtpZ/AtpI family protein [Nocardioides solisilvae]|uniref:AtpZ/AtpI family protein n=1 Tax=Nocardioides solisilvae TaxID=1542435 RepID=UPI000D74EF6F|nr:AtpZ/AtpI family protein [Nocardioides solisilvae]